MKSMQEIALAALLDNREADAEKLIAQLLPGERKCLTKAAGRLAELCKGMDVCSIREDANDECPNCYRVGHAPHVHDGKEFCAGCDPEGAPPKGDGEALPFSGT